MLNTNFKTATLKVAVLVLYKKEQMQMAFVLF